MTKDNAIKKKSVEFVDNVKEQFEFVLFSLSRLRHTWHFVLQCDVDWTCHFNNVCL